MYASLFTFKTAPGERAEAEGMADEIYSLLQGVKGFKSAVFYCHPDNDEYYSLYIWETLGDLEAAYEWIQPKLQEMVVPHIVEPPMRQIFEVYEPKT